MYPATHRLMRRPTRDPRSVWRVAIVPLVLAHLACLSAAATARAETIAEARRRLVDLGLHEFGTVWIDAVEVQLRRDLGQLDDLEKTCRESRARISEMVAKNQQLTVAMMAAKAAHAGRRRELSNPKIVGAARNATERALGALDARIKQLTPLQKSAEQFGAVPEVRKQVVRLINARGKLALRVTSARRALRDDDSRYQRYRDDKQALAALRTLGERHRIGPAKNYRGVRRRLAKAEGVARSQPVPIYREEYRFRVGIIVNDRVPAIFSIRDSNGPTIIPDSLAQAAGVTFDPDGRRAIYQLGKRRLTLREATISSLRIGPHKLRNIKAYVLPPEGEDLGAKIGRIAFTGYETVVDGSRLQITLKPIKP